MAGPNINRANAFFDSVGLGVVGGVGLIVRDPQSATLATTIEGGLIRLSSSTPGEEYNEFRIADTSKTFTASKDTYVYVSSAGALGYDELANDAAKPSQADIEALGGVGAQLIAKVVTDGTRITDGGVTDLRQFSGADVVNAGVGYMSFAATEVGDMYWVAPCDLRILKAVACVVDTLAGTDAATLTFYSGVNDKYTALTNGVITLALSSATGTRASCVPTAYRTLRAGNSVKITGAKTTAGGTCDVNIIYEALP